jgi:hypothetical protein
MNHNMRNSNFEEKWELITGVCEDINHLYSFCI